MYTLGFWTWFWTMCSIQSDNLWSFQFGARKLTRQLHFNKYKPSWISMKLLSCLLLSVSGNLGKKILWKFIHRSKHFSEDLLNLMNRTYGADCWNKEIHKISLKAPVLNFLHARSQPRSLGTRLQDHWALPACRRLLFPLLHEEKEIGEVCTQARINK